MNRPLNALALVATVALAFGCTGSERQTQLINRSWPAAGVQRLELKTVNGEITISAGKPGVITMEAEAHLRGRRDVKPESILETELSDGVLTIRETARKDGFRFPFLNFNRSEQEIDYRIGVPPAIALRINNVNGEINVEGIETEAVIHSVNGAIEFRTNAATLEAKTVNGSIDASFRKSFPGAKIRTINGPVVVTVPANTRLACSISQVNGGFESNIPVEVSNGDSSASGAGVGRLQVSTVNGDIRVRKLELQPAAPPVPAPPAPPGAEIEAPPVSHGSV